MAERNGGEAERANFHLWEAGFCIAVGICLAGRDYLGLPRAVEIAGLAAAMLGILFGSQLLSLAVAATVCGVQFEGDEGYAGIPGLNAMNLACGLYLVRMLIFPTDRSAASLDTRFKTTESYRNWSVVFWSYSALAILRIIGVVREGDLPLSFTVGFARNVILFFGARRLAATATPTAMLGVASVLIAPAILLSAWVGRIETSVGVSQGFLRQSLAFNANGVCFWADLLVITCLAYWAVSRKTWTKPLLGLSLLVLFFTVAVSFSRDGQICFAIGMISWMLLVRQGRFTGLLLIAGLLAILLVGKLDYFSARWHHSIENPEEIVGVEDEGSRVDNWLRTLEAAKQNIIFGLGGRTYVDYLEQKYGYAFRSHNEYLEVLADAGLIGLSVYLVMLFKLWSEVRAVRARAKSEGLFLVATVSVIWLLMYMVFNMAGAVALAGPRSLPLYILVGALAGGSGDRAAAPDVQANARKGAKWNPAKSRSIR